MQKKIILGILFIFIWINGFIAVSAASVEEEIKTASMTFFSRLRDGDEQALMALLGGELGDKKKKVISNKGFKNFIQRYYQNSEFNIVSVNKIDDQNYTVNFEVIIDDQIEKAHTLYFRKINDVWKMNGEDIRPGK